MSREETKKLLIMISATYPNFRLPDREIALEIWTECLDEYSVGAVMGALKIYIKTNTSGFAPSPGQLIEIMHGATRETLTDGQAWALISKALRNGTYGYKEEYEKLPVEVQLALGSAERLRAMATDTTFNESTVSRAFMSAYNNVIAGKRTAEKIPSRDKETLRIEMEGFNNATISGCRCDVSVLPLND